MISKQKSGNKRTCFSFFSAATVRKSYKAQANILSIQHPSTGQIRENDYFATTVRRSNKVKYNQESL